MRSGNYHLRRYQPQDVGSILDIFRANLVEEWTKYHDGKYLPNALKYVEETCSERGDLRNIEKVYFENGGYFWVLADDDRVCGTLGLEKVSDSACELRRMCTVPEIRRQGWGTKMFAALKEKAVDELGHDTILCSTPEHGQDNNVLQFYNSLGFVDTGKRVPIHDSPVMEVFLEWKAPAN